MSNLFNRSQILKEAHDLAKRMRKMSFRKDLGYADFLKVAMKRIWTNVKAAIQRELDKVRYGKDYDQIRFNNILAKKGNWTGD